MINPFDPRPRAFRAWLNELTYPLLYTVDWVLDRIPTSYDPPNAIDRPLLPPSSAPCHVCLMSGDCPTCNGKSRPGAESDPCPTCKGATYCWRCGGAATVDVRWWKRGIV